MIWLRKLSGICLFLILITAPVFGQLRLPRLVSDGMVLQRNADVKIWGWAGKNEQVKLNFLGNEYQSKADKDGNWQFILSGLEAGGPYEMVLMASDTITLENILIGEVWVCSGQSQMDINMERVSPLYQEEIKNAGNDRIRYFTVPTVYNFKEPQTDYPYGNWETISQENILKVSAIAYFFAVEINATYGVPVGMIRSSLGGSPAQAWLSEDAVKQFPAYYDEAMKFRDDELIKEIETRDRENSHAWYSEMNAADEGYGHPELPWKDPAVDVSGWPEMEVPGYWADGELGWVNGVVWFRKDIDIPEEMAGKPARLNLGTLVDADSAFVNGTFVGTTGYQYPPRRYTVPENVLKPGKNTLVVRLISNGGKGGFIPDKPYELLVEGKTIDLKGNWKYHLGAKMGPTPPSTFIRWKPTGLFNGMIAPLSNYTIKGVLWYQGESNTGNPGEYAGLFQTLIKNWRDKWGIGDFPFLFVQLHNYMESCDHPTESNWARTREAQLRALTLPNTAMAVAIDLGVWNDIHPLNKKDVAKRLALAARKTAYNETDLVASGPMFRSMLVKGNKAGITFTETGSGLIVKGGGELKEFAIAGEDGKFVWAQAKIEGDKVIVWSDKVKKPVAVRYAWADNPDEANLYNKEGLPAAPFRTDSWEATESAE
ncbi:MAG: sialate O-acetylesterase [Bacteroidales bacterium]|nr:sialate O-acetylesterase [Bacteroidales bacterium]